MFHASMPSPNQIIILCLDAFRLFCVRLGVVTFCFVLSWFCNVLFCVRFGFVTFCLCYVCFVLG